LKPLSPQDMELEKKEKEKENFLNSFWTIL
jgi:hypothetical protein